MEDSNISYQKWVIATSYQFATNLKGISLMKLHRDLKNIKRQLFGMQEGRCSLCKHEIDFRHMEVDHVITKAKGGPDDDTNLQLLCGHCNRVKGKGTMAEARVRLTELKVTVR